MRSNQLLRIVLTLFLTGSSMAWWGCSRVDAQNKGSDPSAESDKAKEAPAKPCEFVLAVTGMS